MAGVCLRCTARLSVQGVGVVYNVQGCVKKIVQSSSQVIVDIGTDHGRDVCTM